MTGGARKRVAQNRRARHDYFIEDTMEAGLVLTGSEVKSLRLGRGSITEAFVSDREGELYLTGAHIPVYEASRENHEPRRPRKLLLHKRQMNSLIGQIRRSGYTVVPLELYFNERGVAKVMLGMARGKRKEDKREAAKARDWQRDKARLMREKS